jgi:hypothetical protein
MKKTHARIVWFTTLALLLSVLTFTPAAGPLVDSRTASASPDLPPLPPPLPPLNPNMGEQLIAEGVVGEPVVVGNHLVYIAVREGKYTIYSVSPGGPGLVIDDSPVGKSALTTDGEVVAWVEDHQPYGESVEGYNLNVGQRYTLIPTGDNEFGGIALDNRFFYQGRRGSVAGGLYDTHPYSTDLYSLISAKGQNPVAANGYILWVEEDQQGCTTTGDEVAGEAARQVCNPLWTLHMRQRDTALTDVTVASSNLGFSGYSIRGDNIVWAAYGEPAFLYNVTTNVTAQISAGAALKPFAANTSVVWTTGPTGKLGEPLLSSIQATTLGGAANAPVSIVRPSTASVQAWGILGDKAVVYTVDDNLATMDKKLYISGLQPTVAPSFQAAPAVPEAPTGPQAPQAPEASCAPSTTGVVDPRNCGSVYYSAPYFYDRGGRWYPRGVQFFLPEYDVTTSSFDNDIFDQPYNNGTYAYWLNLMKDYTQANLVRIFVAMPAEGRKVPADVEEIYKFAQLAAARGMRLGVVILNSSGWDLDFVSNGDTKRNWINRFISRFSGNDASMIAYVNLNNEINLHCANNPDPKQDCYDRYANTFNEAQYVQRANNYVYQVNNIFKNRRSLILTTVGLSTGVRNTDNLPTVNDFFRYKLGDVTVLPLFENVDFLSPHNYENSPYQIEQDIRYRDQRAQVNSTILLEEFGWFTDPLPLENYQRYREGCWDPNYPDNPGLQGTGAPPCPNSNRNGLWASGRIELQAEAIRGANQDVRYGGGVAFMLVDMNKRSCDPNNTANYRKDFFSGLFATWLSDGRGAYYCGGTYAGDNGRLNSNVKVVPKATAFRIRTHHCYYGRNGCR